MDLLIPRSHPHETWRWFWPDTLLRLVPFTVVGLLAAHFLGGWAAVGLVAPPQGWLAAVGLGLVVGLPMLALAVAWRARIAPRYRLPTQADQALQSLFYLVMNAPVEELFWRGVLQTLAIRALLAVGAGHGWAVGLGVAAVSIIFGAYHRLGGYPWSFNIAAMLAGAVFGLVYALSPGPSLVAVTIVHGLTTAGYLSWGDVALHHLHLRQVRRQPKREPEIP